MEREDFIFTIKAAAAGAAAFVLYAVVMFLRNR